MATGLMVARQIGDQFIVEEAELWSDATDPYSDLYNVVSVVASTKTVTVVAPSMPVTELVTDRIQEGDLVKITGGDAAGTYSVDQVIGDTSFTVKDTIPDATSGSLQFYFRAGSEITGFNNTVLSWPLTLNTVQKAIEYLGAGGLFRYAWSSWGRSGNVGNGAALYNETVPSDITGRSSRTALTIDHLRFSCEVNTTCKVFVYHHTGNRANLTLISSYQVTATNTESFEDGTSIIPANKQIAIIIDDGNARNPLVDLELSSGGGS